MNAYELVEKVGGEIVRGIARVRQGKAYVVLGKLNGNSMELTDAGRAMVASLDAPVAEEPVAEPVKETKPRGLKPKKADVMADIDFND